LAAVAPSSQKRPLVLPDFSKAQGQLIDLGRPPTTKSIFEVDAIHHGALELYERQDNESGETVLGIILQRPSHAETAFDDTFASLLLDGVRLFTSAPQAQTPDMDLALRSVTHKITDLFDMRLRYITEGDKWSGHGRSFFFDRVYEFVRRGARVEFCLPAFPCKSSNPEKVVGVVPDRGEQLALENLHSFVEAIESIYKPGAKLWVVSDGHVFSDCSELFPLHSPPLPPPPLFLVLREV
jgi:hypothetical protein